MSGLRTANDPDSELEPARAGEPTVLVVDDDEELADTYALWLEQEYDVRTAYSGAEGLTWYDSGVDVVLIDRRMPDLSGSRVLRQMEARDFADQKAMLTSAEPGADIADLPCDDYLTKPVDRDELLSSVEDLLLRADLDDDLQDHFALCSKLAALEASEHPDAPETRAQLEAEVERTRERIQDRLEELELEAAAPLIQ